MNPTTDPHSDARASGTQQLAREDGRNAAASRSDRDRVSAVSWLLPAVALIGIVAVSLAPTWDPDFPGPDNLPHGVAYAALTLTLLPVTRRHAAARPWTLVAVATALALLVVVLGALLELGQGVVHRDVEAVDVAANAAGVAAALVAWLILQTVRGSRTPPSRAGGTM